ncbi:MAG: pectate lyase [Planctomycetaceae bacterium]|nr:pectate lyase [Planctomycetaceae bacterium]
MGRMWKISCCLLFFAFGQASTLSATENIADNEATALEQALEQTYEPLDLSLFRDSIGHWQMKDGRVYHFERYQPEQVVHIAENFLKFQNEDGGWTKNLDWLAKAEPDQIREIRGGTLGRSTFDNRNTYSQIAYLAKVYQLTHLERYRKGAEKGLRYILTEQRPSGGWRGQDVDAITFNDDVMTGIMRLLLQIRNQEPLFDWLEPDLRDELNAALDRGIAVTLACQIEVNGKKTAWCQQHDHQTLKPTKARAYELPSITPSESGEVVRFLMSLPKPDEKIIAAVEAAVAWMEEVKIEGIRVKEISIKPVVFQHHTTKIDRVVVQDPNAPPIWTRFYEIETNRPFFCNRDGKKVYQLSDVHLERRSGYGWYTNKPERIITVEYPAWKKQLAVE